MKLVLTSVKNLSW